MFSIGVAPFTQVPTKSPEQNDSVDAVDSILVTRQYDKAISDTAVVVDSASTGNTYGKVLSADSVSVTDSVSVINGLDPATNLYLTAWFQGFGGGASWSPSASLGTSGLVTTTATSMTNGATLNGLATASFNGTSSILDTSPSATTNSGEGNYINMVDAGDLWPQHPIDDIQLAGHDYTVVMLINATSATGLSTTGFNNGLIRDANVGHWGIELQSGPIAVVYHVLANTAINQLSVSISTATWFLLQVRYTAKTRFLEIRTNHNSWTTGTVPPPGFATSGIVGTNSHVIIGNSNSGLYTGLMAEIMVANVYYSDTVLSRVIHYINGKYALSL